MIAFPNVPAAQMSGQEQSISVELVGARPLHLLRKPFPLKSPTGAFVADANGLQCLDGSLDALGGHLGLFGVAEGGEAEIALAALAEAHARGAHHGAGV